MSLWLLVQRGISLPLAKGSESHRGRDGKRNVVDSIKRLSGSPALAELFMFSKSPLGWIGVVKWVWHIAVRPRHALVGHRGSRIIPGSQAWYRAEQWWEWRRPAYQIKCISTASCVDQWPRVKPDRRLLIRFLCGHMTLRAFDKPYTHRATATHVPS